MRRWLIAGGIVAVVALAVIAVVGGDGEPVAGLESSAGAKAVDGDRDAASPQAATTPPEPYKPDRAEEFPRAKRVASRVAEQALTYQPGASARRVAGSLPRLGQSSRELVRVLEPVVDPAMRSLGTVVYPQLSGVTDTTLGAMVITRQLLEAPDGSSGTATRVLDVRLRLAADGWRLDRIASVGGSPVSRSDSLPATARQVLDSPKITLSDSARWDIHRGLVDASLLETLAKAAKKHELSVGIFQSGHPVNVWETSRTSAHAQGFAADIYAVDGRPVIRQRGTKSPAYALAQMLYDGGATQLGSPWVFEGRRSSSFSDAVHQDHIHLQQSPVA